MPNRHAPPTDSYDAAIAPLEKRLAAINKRIVALDDERSELSAILERLRKMRPADVGHIEAEVTAALAGPNRRPMLNDFPATNFSGLSIAAAIKKYLEVAGRPAGAKEIVDALREGGVSSKSKNLYATVFTTMGREAARGGGIVKVGPGKWGLAEESARGGLF